ncbi:hypothetical protein HHK36_013272 [Tetracentron sinense]|uniref:5'-3' exonuclease domain-containing protein n=1 Tax=Tetracentron sinense TaxID=13715 RepID=A0A835DF88_TETSI|nr:hypothetical protein HHK36_013272 [Tetracentron sinense]
MAEGVGGQSSQPDLEASRLEPEYQFGAFGVECGRRMVKGKLLWGRSWRGRKRFHFKGLKNRRDLRLARIRFSVNKSVGGVGLKGQCEGPSLEAGCQVSEPEERIGFVQSRPSVAAQPAVLGQARVSVPIGSRMPTSSPILEDPFGLYPLINWVGPISKGLLLKSRTISHPSCSARGGGESGSRRLTASRFIESSSKGSFVIKRLEESRSFRFGSLPSGLGGVVSESPVLRLSPGIDPISKTQVCFVEESPGLEGEAVLAGVAASDSGLGRQILPSVEVRQVGVGQSSGGLCSLQGWTSASLNVVGVEALRNSGSVEWGQEDASIEYSVASGGLNFRHTLYPSYKSNRDPTPDTVVQGLQYLKASIKAMSIKVIEVPGVEADDVIGTLAAKSVDAGFKVRVVSPDKDFFQILSPSLRLLRMAPRGFEMTSFGLEDFAKKYGALQPSQFVDVISLVGDKADNIPGVDGIGDVHAVKLITKFGTLENLLQCVDQVEEERIRKALISSADQALLSKNLAMLRSDLPFYMVPFETRDLMFKKPEDNGEKFTSLLTAISAYAEGFSADRIIRRAFNFFWHENGAVTRPKKRVETEIQRLLTEITITTFSHNAEYYSTNEQYNAGKNGKLPSGATRGFMMLAIADHPHQIAAQ